MTLLRLLKKRESYEKLVKAVPKHVLDIKTQTILDDFGKFFREYPEADIDPTGPFATWFFAFGHPKLNDEQRGVYRGILSEIKKDIAPDIEQGLMARLVAADTASKLTTLIEKWQDGDEIDLGSTLRTIMEKHELDVGRKVKTPWVQDPIEDLLADHGNDKGFHWRQDALNLATRPLVPGDFGIIAARPDVGKTSFCTDALAHFATQVDDLFPGEQRSILWFNNEGPGKRIVSRCYQSALNATMSDLVARSQAGTVRKDYLEATGGRPDVIRVYDIHDMWNYEVEDIIRATPPAIILFDMVDNIRFGGDINNNGQRTDQLLEAMYQWSRVLAVKHECIVLATSQVSADGENLQYPTLSMLKDSKTGKQGAADFILTIGTNPDLPSSRYLGFTKNKLLREGSPKQPKIEVVFDFARGRYNEPSGS